MGEVVAMHDYGFGPGPERWISRKELAEIMGVSTRTIDRLVGEGMPSTTWGLRTRRFKASVAITWAHGRSDVPTAADQ